MSLLAKRSVFQVRNAYAKQNSVKMLIIHEVEKKSVREEKIFRLKPFQFQYQIAICSILNTTTISSRKEPYFLTVYSNFMIVRFAVGVSRLQCTVLLYFD